MKIHHLAIVYNNYYDNYVFDQGEVIKSYNQMLTLMNMQTTLTTAPPPHVRKFYIPTLTFIILVSCHICTHTCILIDCISAQRCLFIFSSFCSPTHSKTDAVNGDTQLQDNPAYGPAGSAKGVKGQEPYETCFQ